MRKIEKKGKHRLGTGYLNMKICPNQDTDLALIVILKRENTLNLTM